MSEDSRWITWNHTAAPPQMTSQRRQPIWRLAKGTDSVTADLLQHEGGATQLQIARNGKWYFGRRYDTRALALKDAQWFRRDLEGDGWTAV